MSIFDYTLNYAFPLSNFDTPNWHEEDWARWRIVDGLLLGAGIAIPYATAAGTANAITVNYVPAETAYVVGRQLSFVAANTTTGAATINVNGIGAIPINQRGIALTQDDIKAGDFVRGVFTGSVFALIEPRRLSNAEKNVVTGPSGATPNAATDFYVESDVSAYIELLNPGLAVQGYMMSTPSNSFDGGTTYDAINKELKLVADSIPQVTIDALGNVTATTFTGDFVGSYSGPIVGNATSASKLQTTRNIALTGSIVGNVNFDGTGNVSISTVIPANSLSISTFLDIAGQSFISRLDPSTGPAQLLTAPQVMMFLPVFVPDVGAGGLRGVVPAPAAGDAAANKYLAADGTWKVIDQEIEIIGAFGGATGTITANTRGFTVIRAGLGAYEITLNTPFANTDYRIFFTLEGNTGVAVAATNVISRTASVIAINTISIDSTSSIGSYDPTTIHVLVTV